MSESLFMLETEQTHQVFGWVLHTNTSTQCLCNVQRLTSDYISQTRANFFFWLSLTDLSWLTMGRYITITVTDMLIRAVLVPDLWGLFHQQVQFWAAQQQDVLLSFCLQAQPQTPQTSHLWTPRPVNTPGHQTEMTCSLHYNGPWGNPPVTIAAQFPGSSFVFLPVWLKTDVSCKWWMEFNFGGRWRMFQGFPVLFLNIHAKCVSPCFSVSRK